MARMYMYQQKYNHAFDLFNQLFTTCSSDSCGFYHQGSILAYICLLKNTKNVVQNVKNLSGEFAILLKAYLKNDIEKLNEVLENRRSEMIEKDEKFIQTQIEIMLEEVKVEVLEGNWFLGFPETLETSFPWFLNTKFSRFP